MKTDSKYHRLHLWRRAWDELAAPALSTRALLALRAGLLADDPRLIKHRIVTPPRNDRTSDAAPLGACALGYCGWQGEGLATCEAVEKFFSGLTFRLTTAAVDAGRDLFLSDFVCWWDVTPREQAVPMLLEAVEAALATRDVGGAA